MKYYLICLLLYAAPSISMEIDSSLLYAVAKVESNLNPKAIGKHGEIGLFQLKLSTARWIGCANTRRELFDPGINTICAYLYLSYLRKISPNLRTAIRSYNVGPNRRMKRDARYHKYVKKVMLELGRNI